MIITYKMSNVNVQKYFSLFVLVLLFQEIRTDWNNITEERKTASIPQPKNSFKETVVNIISTTDIVVDNEKFDDNELKKLFQRNFKLYENLERSKNRIKIPETRAQRKSRGVINGSSNYGMECFSCYANSTSKNDDNCYEGVSMPTKKCADAEHCFIELNPLFIKRGCVLPGRVNRTFICKCPLCNDKPSFDISHYEYKKLNDWEYDNARLQMPLVGMDLMCKVCETKGTNPTSDKNCRYGKNADYMVCAHSQLCYTNVDDETDFVSRGCIDRPLFNSIYYFCNNTECNTDKFPNPREKARLRAEEIKLKDEPDRKKKKPIKSWGSKICTNYLYAVLLIILSFMECI